MNAQPATRPIAALARRPDPFDSVVGNELTPPGAEYPRGPRKVEYLGTIEWIWGFMHERVSPYYLHRARRHWMLWTKVPDEWERPQWMPLGYVPFAQATRDEAAVHLVFDSLRFERDHLNQGRFDAVTTGGHLRSNQWASIRHAIWPPETSPPAEVVYPVTQWLPVPTGEEGRLVAVAAALHDSAFRSEEVNHADPRSCMHALRDVDEETAAAIRGDSDAMGLLAFLAKSLESARTAASGSEVALPKAAYTILPAGGVRFHSQEGGPRAVSVAHKLSLALPQYYEREWTPDADARLRAYLARPGYTIPAGVGTREAASSMGAIYMALTGKLANKRPPCMSYVIGRWIVFVQDRIPQKARDDCEWRNLLRLAARSRPEGELELKRLDVVIDWVWETVLPTLEPVAEKYDIGMNWRRVLARRTVRSTAAGVKTIEGLLESLGEDFLPALHDDDLWDLLEAAKAAREIAIAPTNSEIPGTRNAHGCLDAAAKAARAAIRTGVTWRTMGFVVVLQRLIGA